MSNQTLDRISLNAAASKHGCNRNSVRAAVDQGRIRFIERQAWGKSDRIFLSEAEFLEDLARLPHCKADGCDERAFAASGYCGDHFRESGREGARDAERALLGDPRRDCYTLEEAANRCGVWPPAIRERLLNGELPGERCGRHWRIPKDPVEALRREFGRRRRSVMPSRQETEDRRRDVQRLHEHGSSAPDIAAELGVDKSTVYNDHKVLELEPRGGRKRARKMTSAERAQLPELYVDRRQTLEEIGTMFEVSPGHVRDALDELDVQRRPSGTRPKHPPAVEQTCAQCGAKFTPNHRGWRDRRYCKEACAQAATRAAYETAIGESELLDPKQIAARLEMSVSNVYALRRAELLVGEELVPAGRSGPPVWAVTEKELLRFVRDWIRGASEPGMGRRRRHLDVEKGIAHLHAIGAIERRAIKQSRPLTDIEILERARLKRRASVFLNRNRGRRPAPTSGHHLELWARYHELKRELPEDWERDNALGLAAGDRPTETDIFEALGEEAWANYPERWSRVDWPAERSDPHALRRDMRKQAGKTVSQVIKRLQKRGTEIPPR